MNRRTYGAMLRLGALGGALQVVLAGCSFIPQGVLEAQRDRIDEDADGYSEADGDCNDTNPNEFPDNPEIPYDGWDNDCSGADLIDMDSDGYPGITREDYEANTDGVWPDDIQGDLDDLDCRDDPNQLAVANQVFPRNTSDRRYDGIDSDCGGDNDFDSDSDGFMPDQVFEAGEVLVIADLFDLFVQEWGYTGPSEFGDCDDLDPDVNPGSTETDEWYDGIDQDCAGNNDFDADADGWMPAGYELEYDDFIQRYHRDGEHGFEAQFGDCLDLAGGDDTQAHPEQVFPGNDEVFYDGVDGDCGGDNDFDADGDGHMPDGSTADLLSYAEVWGYEFPEHVPVAQEGDCDDLDSTVSPVALEVLADKQDQDCDGGDSTSQFGFGDLIWNNPRSPEIEYNGRHIVLSSIADLFVDGAVETDEAGVALFFDPATVSNRAQPDPNHAPLVWQGSGLTRPPLLAATDLDVDPSGNTWVAVSYTFLDESDLPDRTWLAAIELDYDLAEGIYVASPPEAVNTSRTFQASGLDLVVDERGDPWLVACGSQDELGEDLDGDGLPDYPPALYVFKGTETGDSAVFEDDGLALQDWYTCVYREEPAGGSAGQIDLCGPEGCVGRNFRALFEDLLVDDTAVWYEELPDWVSNPYVQAAYDDGLHVFVDSNSALHVWDGEVGESYDVLGGRVVLSAEAAIVDGDLYVGAVVLDGGEAEVLLAWGDPAAGLAETFLPMEQDGITYEPLEVALDATEDHISLAVSASDAMAWAFFGR